MYASNVVQLSVRFFAVFDLFCFCESMTLTIPFLAVGTYPARLAFASSSYGITGGLVITVTVQRAVWSVSAPFASCKVKEDVAFFEQHKAPCRETFVLHSYSSWGIFHGPNEKKKFGLTLFAFHALLARGTNAVTGLWMARVTATWTHTPAVDTVVTRWTGCKFINSYQTLCSSVRTRMIKLDHKRMACDRGGSRIWSRGQWTFDAKGGAEPKICEFRVFS